MEKVNYEAARGRYARHCVTMNPYTKATKIHTDLVITGSGFEHPRRYPIFRGGWGCGELPQTFFEILHQKTSSQQGDLPIKVALEDKALQSVGDPDRTGSLAKDATAPASFAQ